MRIKLIASDIDGTIINDDGFTSEKTKEVIHKLKDHDIEFMFATGRSFDGAYEIAEQLGLENESIGVVCLNGLQTYQLPEKTKIEREALPYKDAISMGEFGREYYMGIMYCFEDCIYFQMDDLSYEDYVYGTGKDARTFFKRDVGFETIRSVDEIMHRLERNEIEKVAFIQSYEYMDIIIDRMKRDLPEGYTLMRVGRGWTEVAHDGVSKGEAILEYAAQRGIKPEEIMVFGDSENDISMFEIAGVAVAMENAMDNARANATQFTLSNNDDGVAEFIENYLKRL